MDPQFQEAVRLHQAGNFSAAAQLYQDVLRRNPRDVKAICSFAFMCFQGGRFEDSQKLFEVALDLAPADVNALCVRGVALMHLQRFEEALACFDRSLAIKPDFVEGLANRATALMELGRIDEALTGFDQVLPAAPQDTNILNNRGNALLLLGRPSEALASYETALSFNSAHADAWYNRGNALAELLRHEGAVESYDRSLAVRPSHAPAWYRRGLALLWLNRPADAVSSFDRALSLDSQMARFVLRARSQAYLQLERHPEAIADGEALLKIDPDAPYVRGDLHNWRRIICDWRAFESDERDRIAGRASGKPVVNPWVSLISCTEPAEQLHWARLWARNIGAGAVLLPPAPRQDRDKIRIAYLSADLLDHAVSHLMIGVFEAHDRTRFETFGISLGSNDRRELQPRLTTALDHFIDVSGKRDEVTAALLRDLDVDIAIDLMGFTTDSRPGILARRPARLQASYVGFAGTMGAPWMDYLIADRIVISDADRRHYDESIVYLPGTYQPYDGGTPPAALPARAEAGLPQSGFVFCAFNNSYKITPELFSVWMRLLAAVPGSVLWLREKNGFAAANLRSEAQRRGIDPQRLIFAPEVPTREEYRARLALADLFLDTLPYGAHTTAADALWAGVPVVTCTGATFAGRVATSILTACGLSETVTASLADYEALALALARDPAALAGVREKVQRARKHAPLFTPSSICRQLEAAYGAMWAAYLRGEKPSDIVVQPVDG
jgi:predicted O-linked N-acetylglucosamine transferase (SPINDLY family)